MAVRRPANKISKNPRVQRFAAIDLGAAFKKYYPKPKETRRALTMKQFNTICYMLGATDYTIPEIVRLVSKLGKKVSRAPVEKINKILKIRTSEEAKAIGRLSSARKLSALSDKEILGLLSKRGLFEGKEDFVFSQSDVVRLSKAGMVRVNRLAKQVRTKEDTLRVSKREEWRKRRFSALPVFERETILPRRFGERKRTTERIDALLAESEKYRKSRKPIQLKTREDWVRARKVLKKSKTYTKGMKKRLRERIARELEKTVPAKTTPLEKLQQTHSRGLIDYISLHIGKPSSMVVESLSDQYPDLTIAQVDLLKKQLERITFGKKYKPKRKTPKHKF